MMLTQTANARSKKTSIQLYGL